MARCCGMGGAEGGDCSGCSEEAADLRWLDSSEAAVPEAPGVRSDWRTRLSTGLSHCTCSQSNCGEPHKYTHTHPPTHTHTHTHRCYACWCS